MHLAGAAHSATHYLSCPPQARASSTDEAGIGELPEEIRLVPHDPLVAGESRSSRTVRAGCPVDTSSSSWLASSAVIASRLVTQTTQQEATVLCC